MLAYAVAAVLAGSALVRAEPVPSAPGPGDVFRQGEQCSITWTPDAAGVWKEMNIQLMTGDNFNMVHISTVATVDGTDASSTTFSYPCPQVTPNSAIYFYQFSTPADPAAITWTTRFTIAGADGSTVPPENDLEPDGQPIPWGVGALVDPSTAVAAPSYLGGAAGSTGTGSTGTPGTTPDVPATDPTTTPSSPAAPPPSSNSNPGLAPPAPTTSNTGLNTSPTTNTTGAGAENENGALRAFGVDSYLARAGLALGVAAFSFAVAL
ncbi:hypothetical protein C8Q76DRAFT_614036 [Earliella scabrosa]|nr:hypothetical protein C8Q76DRAFT_614036 [Earliella scabrosa]